MGSEATDWSGQEKPKSEQPNTNTFNTLCSHLPGLAPLFCDLPLHPLLRRGLGPKGQRGRDPGGARNSRRAVGATGKDRCVSCERAEGCQQEPARGPGPAPARAAPGRRCPSPAGRGSRRGRRCPGHVALAAGAGPAGGSSGPSAGSTHGPAPAHPLRGRAHPARASRLLGVGTGPAVTQGTAARGGTTGGTAAARCHSLTLSQARLCTTSSSRGVPSAPSSSQRVPGCRGTKPGSALQVVTAPV